MSNQPSPENSQDYPENAALIALFGESLKVKILAVLLQQGRDSNVSMIADVGGMSRSSVYRYIDELRELGVVTKTREIGGSPLYQIDKSSTVATKLAELEWVLVDEIAGETDEAVDDGFEISESPPE